MGLCIGAPARQRPGPAIVVMYHRGGIDAFTMSVVERLSSNGYLAAVPDVYHRCPIGTPAGERKNLLRDSEIVEDVEATLAHLRNRADVDPDRIVVMGHCMGGRMALLVAGSVPAFCGAVIYYGGSVNKSWGEGPAPFERLRNIRCRVIGFFGDRDTHPSPEDVNRIDSELRRHDIAHVFHRYPDVGHGFQNPAHDTPEEHAAAEDAWAKTFDYLREVAPV